MTIREDSMPMRLTLTLALAAVLAAACGVDKDLYAAKELEAQQNMRKYQDESQKNGDLAVKVAELSGRMGVLEEESRQLSERVRAEEVNRLKHPRHADGREIFKGHILLSEVEGTGLRHLLAAGLFYMVFHSSLDPQGPAAAERVAAPLRARETVPA